MALRLVVGSIAFATWMIACVRVNQLIDRMIDQNNAKCARHERVPLFGFSRQCQAYDAPPIHKRLYPDSGLRRQYYRWLAAFIGLALLNMCFFLFWY